jgi:hypothetical protein
MADTTKPHDHSNDGAGPEHDDRFPSGPWFGYYQQWGSQSRQRLWLHFASGAIRGGGRDPAGPFDVRGTYDADSGRVTMSKVYAEHRVDYDGAADGDGIGGDWSIAYFGGMIQDRGHFRIWPDELAMQQSKTAEAEAPAQEPAAV